MSLSLGDTDLPMNTISNITIDEYDVNLFIFAIKNIQCFTVCDSQTDYPIIYDDDHMQLRIAKLDDMKCLYLSNIDIEDLYAFIITDSNIDDIINKKATVLFSNIPNHVLTITYNSFNYININHIEVI